MNTFRKFRVVLYLTLLFAAGAALGLGWSQARRPAWTQSPEWAERWLERRMHSDFKAIQASPEQQARLRPLYDQLLADFKTTQVQAEAALNAAFGRFGLEMSRKLTPEQVEAFQRHNAQIKAKQRRGAPDAAPPSSP